MANRNDTQRLYVAGLTAGELMPPESIKRYERERTHRSYTFDNVVVRFARWFALYCFLLGFAAGAAVIVFWGLSRGVPLPTAQGILASLMLGLATAGAGGATAAWYKSSEFVGLMVDYEATEFQDAPPPPPPPDLTLWNDQPLVKRRRSKQVEYDGHAFVFTGRNLDTLLTWHNAGEEGKSVRRDNSPDLPGFNALPDPIKGGDYTTALYVLRGRGLVDARNSWTTAGREFLSRE